MDLYFSAAKVLQQLDRREGSIKGLTLQSTDAIARKNGVRLYALVLETLKYRDTIDAVVASSQLFAQERKLVKERELVQVLVHDVLFNKRGVVAKHPLQAAVDRHRARLKAELTKLQIKRKAANVKDLAKAEDSFVPRWARVNRVKADTPSVVAQLTAQSRYVQVSSLSQLAVGTFCIDSHIPDLLAFHPDAKLTEEPLYKSGALILQNKASCIPAVLLGAGVGDVVIDGCAAPGNKTSHAAAILHAAHADHRQVQSNAASGGEAHRRRKKVKTGHDATATTHSVSNGGIHESEVIAFERDPRRVQVLRTMLTKAGLPALSPGNSDYVSPASRGFVRMTVHHEDFTRIPPTDPAVSHATHIMLDPSCSGSGIVNRLDYLTSGSSTSALPLQTTAMNSSPDDAENDNPTSTDAGVVGEGEGDRLANLAAFQLAILRHAMSFPKARRIVYSTCSVHAVEDEAVVVAALLSKADPSLPDSNSGSGTGGQGGTAGGEGGGWSAWRLSPRETVLPSWPIRGRQSAVLCSGITDEEQAKSLVEGMIRCLPGLAPTSSTTASISPSTSASASTSAGDARRTESDTADDEVNRLTPAEREKVAGTIGFFVAVLERHPLLAPSPTTPRATRTGPVDLRLVSGADADADADVEAVGRSKQATATTIEGNDEPRQKKRKNKNKKEKKKTQQAKGQSGATDH